MSTFTLQDLNLPMTADEAMKALEQHAPEPQPTLETNVPSTSQVSPEKVIDEMVAQFSISLRLLLTTVISSSAAKSEAESQSLQDCVALTLQQADWFKSMVGTYVDEYDFESHVHDSVKDCVETEVDSYFQNSFDPEYHFDFGDAVENAVDDRLEDIVREKIDEVVAEQLEELVAQKLQNLRVVFD